MTYRELDEAVAAEPEPRQAVVVPARGTHEFVRSLWAAWRAGQPFVPHDPRLSGVGLLFPTGAAAPATVILTSGTTGEPKAVGLTAENHEASAIASAWSLGVAPDDRWLCCLPLWHIGGLAILHRSAIYATTAVVHDGFHPDAVREALRDVTIVSLVATMLRRLELREWPSLRAALVGGGPVPRDLIEWAADTGFPLVPTYGMTETASQVVTAGRPLLGVELKIADDGEILVRGPMVAPTEVDADGWLHTRDRGSIDEDGSLRVEGRLDDVIVTGGENVAAAEVEEALLSHPAVADAAVAGRPDPKWGQAVTAFVVLSAKATDDELIDHCRTLLAGHKVPKVVVRLDELPRNAAGKVLRARL